MKQLSSSELNNMSKEDLAAMVLQMQQLHQQLQQQQKQMEQQIHTLNEKIAIMNARHFGRSTEKLESLPGQMNIFNETEVAAAEAIAEPAIEQVVVRRKKKKGQRKEDLSRLPKRVENHELTKEQLKAICYPSNYPRLEASDYLGNNRQNQWGQMTNRSIICGCEVALFAVKKLASDTAVTSTRGSRRPPRYGYFWLVRRLQEQSCSSEI